MITLEDCEAFCDADPALVEAVTRREHVTGIAALAQAQALTSARQPVVRMACERPLPRKAVVPEALAA